MGAIADIIGTLRTTFRIAKATFDAGGLTAARTFTLQDQPGTIGHVVQAIQHPAGRVTLESGVAVSTTDQLAKTSVFYAPYVGELVPIYNGTVWTPTVFTELTLALDSDSGHTGYHRIAANFDLFIVNDAGTMRLGTGPMWTRASTVTITNASPGVVTWTAHGLGEQMSVVFTSTGALPTGLTAGTVYYVKSVLTADTFTVSATPGGSVINTSSAGSGTHTATESNTARGTGAGTTEIEPKNALWTNKVSMTLRWGSASGNTITVAANQGTYVGTMRASANGQCEDSLAKRFLWNAYNRVPRPMRVLEATNSWTYSTLAYRQMNGSTANQLDMVRGLNEDLADAIATGYVGSSTASARSARAAVGLDDTTAFAPGCCPDQASVSSAGVFGVRSRYVGLPGLGRHFLAALEIGAGTDTQTWYGDDNTPTVIQAGILGGVLA